MVRCWLGSLSSWSAVTSWEKRAVHQVAPLWLLVGNSCWLPEWCKKIRKKSSGSCWRGDTDNICFLLVPLPVLWHLSYDALIRPILYKHFLFHCFSLKCFSRFFDVLEPSQRHLGLDRLPVLVLWSGVRKGVVSFHCLGHMTSDNILLNTRLDFCSTKWC